MIDLQKYLFNKVLLIDIDGKQWNGYVFSFHDKDDNEDEEDSITLKVIHRNRNKIYKNSISLDRSSHPAKGGFHISTFSTLLCAGCFSYA